MWTSTMELNPRRVMLTRLLGLFWNGAFFSSFAPLQVQNVPRQSLPSQNWVRVRNRLAGICGSDLHLIYTDGDFRIAPAALPNHQRSYPGHEVVGEVIEVGEDVTQLRVGDRVVLQNGPNCLSTGAQPVCRACASGNYNLCEQGHLSGPEPIGGGWSEEMLLHEQQLFRIPPDLSDEQAVMLEPSAVAVHAVLRHLPQPGEHVLIIGAGTIGLLVLQVLRALAPQTTISVMARHSFQIEQATRMGAEYILYPHDTYQSVKLLTGAKLYKGILGNKMLLGGYDAVYDTVGTQRTLHDALRWTRAGGALVIVGLSLHLMRIDLTPVWYQEVSLIGSTGHGTETWPIGSQQRRDTFAIAAELIEQGGIHPEKLITHRFALTNFREALSTAAGKSRSRAIKVVFDYALLPASVVPNVRSVARQRRPVRSTATRTTGDQAEQLAQGNGAAIHPTYVPEQPVLRTQSGQAEEQWEPVGGPTGDTWSHSVQPFPQTYTDQEDQPGESSFYGFSESSTPFAPPEPQATPAEYVFPAMPFITEEPGPYQAVSDEPTPHTLLTEEPAPQNQAVSDEPMPHTMLTEEPAPQNAPREEPAPYQAQAVSDEPIPQNAPTEESYQSEGEEQTSMAAQPVTMTDAAQTSEEDEGDVKTVVVPKPVRPRNRSASRRTTGDAGRTGYRNADATNDAPDTLQQ